jgi:DNA-binding transcriptional LysR family regulator
MNVAVNADSLDGSIDSIDGVIPTAPVADRWLRTFEVVASIGTFTGAAARLGVGQSSVSHAIKQLESALGVRLFVRSERGVDPTEAGERLARHVRPAFEMIDGGVRDVRRLAVSDDVVAISVSTSFAAWWLLPRLAEFKAASPDVELRCITSDNDDRVGVDDADLWIPHGANRWERLVSAHLTDERIVAVATPSIAAALVDTDDPSALLDADLLHLEERYGARFDWVRWFDHHGIAAPNTRGARSNDYSVIVQAALDGQGVALGWAHITDPLVEQGRLVQVGGEPIVTDQSFVILSRPGPRRPAVDALQQWLIATTP